MKIKQLFENEKPPFVKTAAEFWRTAHRRKYPIINLDGAKFQGMPDLIASHKVCYKGTSVNASWLTFNVVDEEPVNAYWYSVRVHAHVSEVVDEAGFVKWCFKDPRDKDDVIPRLLKHYKSGVDIQELESLLIGFKKLGIDWEELDAIEKSMRALHK